MSEDRRQSQDRRKPQPQSRPPPAGRDSLRWLIVSAAVLVADQITKYVIVTNMELYQRIDVSPVLDIVRLHNTGAAFSIFADASGWQHWLFIALALAVSVAIIWWQWRLPKVDHRVLALGLALVLGGAIGNVIDRFVYGYVVDFILVYFREWHYPAFNVADSAITCGVILIIIDGLYLERKRGGRRAGDFAEQ
jgi:signal peptidase II